MPLSAGAVAYTVAGGLILYSGIKGDTLADMAKSVLTGNLGSIQDTETIGTPTVGITSGTSGSPGTTSSDVANTALSYIGSKYVWGGAPGTTVGTDNGTDCSGFTNMVIGRDLKQAIPGMAAGKYTGSTHGPATGAWLLWGGAKTIAKGSAQAGDLACWLTHIGIYTDAGAHVVSSLDTQSGVIETTVAGATPTGEPLTVRRLG